MLYLGELAAIATSITFAVNSTLFTEAGLKVGSVVVNRIRLIAACLFLSLGHWLILGTPVPLFTEPERWLWLGLSGIVGLVLGDAFLFQAFIWVGPRISMLMMSLAPIIAGLTAWIFLGEKLTPWQMIGILITLLGIAWVIIDKNGDKTEERKDYFRGVLYGFGGAAGQGLGIVLAKNGLGGDFSALSANFIRILVAMIVIWLITIIRREFLSTFQTAISKRKVLWWIISGAFFGPFVGVSLSLFALQYTSIGVASTLMALPPIFLLPVEGILYKKRVGLGAVAGTIIALAGVAVLFLA